MFKKTNIFNYFTKFYFPYRDLLLDKLLNIRHNKILFGKDIKLHNYKKIKLGKHILINDNFTIIGNGLVNIDDYTYTAPNVTIITTTHNKENMDKVIGNVHIESLCWIGANVTILQGVSIGEGSIIGAGSVVSKNIEPYSIAYGSPIKIRSKRHITYPYRLPGGKFYLMKKDLIVSHFDV